MNKDHNSFKSLVNDLYYEEDITDLEKCVVLLQMLTFVGDDLYDDYVNFYPGKCVRKDAENFLKENVVSNLLFIYLVIIFNFNLVSVNQS